MFSRGFFRNYSSKALLAFSTLTKNKFPIIKTSFKVSVPVLVAGITSCYSHGDFDRFGDYSSAFKLNLFQAYALSFSSLYSTTPSFNTDKYAGSAINIDFWRQIEAVVGEKNCVVSEGAIASHSLDFSYHDQVNPEAVIYVQTTEEVSKVVALCNQFKIPIIPYGSGTSLEGHVIPHGPGCITIDMSRMNKIIKLNKEDMDVIVEPGITYDELNKQLAPHGFWFPLDPGPGASIGGMIGTSCSGTNAVRYGTAKDQVLSLKVVTANGSVVKTGVRAKKSSAGYDLTHLFIGSEGTLGIVVQATLKLQKIPETKMSASKTFETLEQASAAVIEMMQNSIRIGKVELLDKVCIQAVNTNNNPDQDPTIPPLFPEKHTLLFEFSGTAVEVQEQLDRTKTIVDRFSKDEFKFASSDEDRAQMWRARKEALWVAPILQPGSRVLITDVCVPISKLGLCLHETMEDVSKSGLIAPLVAHAGDGNFHLFVLFDPDNPTQVQELHNLNAKLIKRAISMEGTCTGEHGVGSGKKNYLEPQLGPEAVQLMKSIKNALDPNGIFNPGKVL